MYIDEVNASSRDARIDQKREDRNRALIAKIYALKVYVHSWRIRNWQIVAEDEPVDQITDSLRGVDNLYFDVLHARHRGYGGISHSG